MPFTSPSCTLPAGASRSPHPPLYTRTQGHLTGAALITSVERLDRTDHVFLCGHTAMVDDLTRDLRRPGIPRENLHYKHFSCR